MLFTKSTVIGGSNWFCLMVPGFITLVEKLWYYLSHSSREKTGKTAKKVKLKGWERWGAVLFIVIWTNPFKENRLGAALKTKRGLLICCTTQCHGGAEEHRCRIMLHSLTYLSVAVQAEGAPWERTENSSLSTMAGSHLLLLLSCSLTTHMHYAISTVSHHTFSPCSQRKRITKQIKGNEGWCLNESTNPKTPQAGDIKGHLNGRLERDPGCTYMPLALPR